MTFVVALYFQAVEISCVKQLWKCIWSVSSLSYLFLAKVVSYLISESTVDGRRGFVFFSSFFSIFSS